MENLDVICWKLSNIIRGLRLNRDSLIALLYINYCNLFSISSETKDEAESLLNENIGQFGNSGAITVFNNTLNEMSLTREQYGEFVKYFVNNYVFSRYDDMRMTSPFSLRETVKQLLSISSNDNVFVYGEDCKDMISEIGETSLKEKKRVSLNCASINEATSLTTGMMLEMVGVTASISTYDLIHTDVPKYNKAYLIPPFRLPHSNDAEELFGFKLNKKVPSELIYILAMLQGLEPGGKMITVVPSGVLYGAAWKDVRKHFIDKHVLSGVISLPEKLFQPYTGISTALLIFEHDKSSLKMIDASEMIAETGKRSIALDSDRIVDAYNNLPTIVDYTKIAANDYIADPARYVNAKEIDVLYPAKLADVVSVIKGSQYTISKFTDSISEVPTDYQLLTSSDIQDGSVDYDSLVYVEPDKKLLKFVLHENDLVVTTKSTVVKTFVASNLPNRNIIVTGGMLILRPDTQKVSSMYLKVFLDSNVGRQLMERTMRGAIIVTISTKDFCEMKISCPPLEKQERDVAKYKLLLSMKESLQQQLKQIQSEISGYYDNVISKEG